MNIHESAEDYLESILMLKEQLGEVRSIDIVNKMNYSKPSISIAMKKLRENGYIEMDENGYITLLQPGLEIAQRCKIEHDIDDDTYDKIRLFYENKLSKENE